jgi:hypothetical protein
MSTLQQLRKLILGETWSLPIGVLVSLGIAGLIRAIAGPDGWWRHAGGYVLFALVAVALTISLAGALRRR